MSEVERMLPLYEGKMIHHFDHRWATFQPDGSTREVSLEEKIDPDFTSLPRYWVRESVVKDKLGDYSQDEVVMGFRGITNTTNERTVINSLIPVTAAGNNLPLSWTTSRPLLLAASLSSFVLDYIARLKVGGMNINFYIAEQFPILPPESFQQNTPWTRNVSLDIWIESRVEELQWQPWNPARREILRAELDAAFFHLYGIVREDVDYIMDTFPIVRRHDEAEHGEFRTKRLILENYDAMALAMRTGRSFESSLNLADSK